MFSAHFVSLVRQHPTLNIHNALVTAKLCAKDSRGYLHYVPCPPPHSVYLGWGRVGQTPHTQIWKTPLKSRGDAAVGWRVFSFGGQGVGNGIDFTVKAELVDLLESSKYTATYILPPPHKWTGCVADYYADTFGGSTLSLMDQYKHRVI